MTILDEIAAYTRSVYDVKDDAEHTFEEIRSSVGHRTRAVTDELDRRMEDVIMSVAS